MQQECIREESKKEDVQNTIKYKRIGSKAINRIIIY